MPAPARIVRVLPDLTGLDRSFDYLVPAGVVVQLGDLVRVPLHGRRIGGWIVAVDPADPVTDRELVPLAKVSSRGPSEELIELASWASWRWAAGRLRPFLVAASPPTTVMRVPGPSRSSTRPGGLIDEASRAMLGAGGGMRRLPPNDDVVPALMAAIDLGPTLVVVGGVDRARLLAVSLRRKGLRVALVPEEWASAAGGVDVVIGARRAAWAPCPDLAVVAIVDEHDDSLQEERSPTWHARDVVVERARRAGVPFLGISPTPTVVGIDALGRRLARPAVADERASWPIVDVVDRSEHEPWKTSLVTPELIRHLRSPATVVCVHNQPGRSRVLACRSCRALIRCARCEAAVMLDDDEQLVCLRCDETRPKVCQACGASGFANLKPGVTRLREELEAAAGRPAVSVTGADDGPPTVAGVYVGTEAVLHRVGRADVVAFLDFDRELVAPRYRASEHAMGLLARAARLLGRRDEGGRLLVQTFLPHHPVIDAARLADPGRVTTDEAARRRDLHLPPFGALASISGPDAAAYVAVLRDQPGVAVGGAGGDDLLVRAPDWTVLADAFAAVPKPPGARLRVEVDPPRR